MLKGSLPGVPNPDIPIGGSHCPGMRSSQPESVFQKLKKKIKAKIIASVEYSKIFYFAPVPSRRMSSSRSEECIVEISSDEEDDFDHLRDGNKVISWVSIKPGRWVTEHTSRFLTKASEPTSTHCTNDEVIKNPVGGHTNWSQKWNEIPPLWNECVARSMGVVIESRPEVNRKLTGSELEVKTEHSERILA